MLKWSKHTDLSLVVMCCPVNTERKLKKEREKRHENNGNIVEKLINIELEVLSLCAGAS